MQQLSPQRPGPESTSEEAEIREVLARTQQLTHATRPGRMVAIEGIVFQADVDHPISTFLIQPVEELSIRVRRRSWRAKQPGVPLANHAGIRVRIDHGDGRQLPYVVEQLTGTLVQTLDNALSWTPWREFSAREGR